MRHLGVFFVQTITGEKSESHEPKVVLLPLAVLQVLSFFVAQWTGFWAECASSWLVL